MLLKNIEELDGINKESMNTNLDDLRLGSLSQYL